MLELSVSLLNGLSYGLLLFLLSAGLTLILSMMGVLNFAHASFYMLGAYVGHALAGWWGFWTALCLAPVLVALFGALFELAVLRHVHRHGHVPELLVTFGLSYVVLELVQLLWGRMPLQYVLPHWLAGPAFTVVQDAGGGLAIRAGAVAPQVCAAASLCSPFPATRALMMAMSLAMLAALWLLLQRSRVGLLIQAALTHPQMVEALGHNVPRLFTWVFGVGAGLAALAGVIGGSTFVTEPAMASALGPVVFAVVVIGGLGSLGGAFIASLVLGVLQTLAVAVDWPLWQLAAALGWMPASPPVDGALSRLTVAQLAPVLPYLLLVLVLAWRPHGWLGSRAP